MYRYYIAFLGLVTSLALDAAATESDLARVAILKFADETGKKDYEWVRTSLPDAINKSMVQKFEFFRTNESKLRNFQNAIDPKDQLALNEIARATGSDIVIFGKYGYADAKDEVVITSYVYHIQGQKIIGESKVIGKLDGTLFAQIDTIAAQSVEHIYQFVLSVSQKKGAEQTHVLVLVPTWSNNAEQKAAEKEIQAMKGGLEGRYKAKFLTLTEFYRRQQTSSEEQENINGFAVRLEKDRIVKWLESQGVEDAFIIFVANKKVSITPVVGGASKKEFSYPVAAKSAEKMKAIETNSQETGIELAGNTTRLSKKFFSTSKRSALHLLGNLSVPAGSSKDFISGGVGGKISYYRNVFAPWLYPIVQFGFQQMGGKIDDSFATSFATLHAGAGYPVFSSGKFSVFPYLSFGATAATLRGTGKTFLQPYGELGILLDYEIFSRVLLVAGFGAGYVADSTRPVMLLNIYLGVGYRL